MIEGCDIDNHTVYREWLSNAIPNQESSSNFLAELKSYDSCTKYEKINEGRVNNFAYFYSLFKENSKFEQNTYNDF